MEKLYSANVLLGVLASRMEFTSHAFGYGWPWTLKPTPLRLSHKLRSNLWKQTQPPSAQAWGLRIATEFPLLAASIVKNL